MNEFKKEEKFTYDDQISYAPKAIVSKHVLKKKTGNITLFAFDKGEELSEHTAPFDAIVQIVDGSATVIIDGNSNNLKSREVIIMPANIPHAIVAK